MAHYTKDYFTLDTAKLQKWHIFDEDNLYKSYNIHTVDTDDTGFRSSVNIAAQRIGEELTLRIMYTSSPRDPDNKSEHDYHVVLKAVPCYYGGKRYLFRCPLVRRDEPCTRFARVLYIRGKYFGCRKCHGLYYKSQYESRSEFSRLLNYLYLDEEKPRNTHYKGKPTKKYLKHSLSLNNSLAFVKDYLKLKCQTNAP